MSAAAGPSVDVAFERWLTEGAGICVQPLDRWQVGDWLVRCPRVRGKYGPAIEAGFAEGTLRAWRWVAANVSCEDRVAALSFRHRYEVAKLASPEQRRLLALAVDRNLSAEALRARIAQEGV